MADELLITRKEDMILSVLASGRRVIQIHAEPVPERDVFEARVGDIYVGKVCNVVKNINAAFVEFARGQMGYLSLAEREMPLHTQGAPFQEGRVLAGDEIIVQIKREASGGKSPTLTGTVNLAGRYAALTVGKRGCHVSKKLRDGKQREHLLELLSRYADEGYSLVARTNCGEAADEVIERELGWLLRRYRDIVTYGMHKTALTKLESAPAGFLGDIRDGYAREVKRILTDQDSLYETIREYIAAQMPGELAKLALWDPSWGKLDAVYDISRTLERAFQTKIWLKSGANLVIQPTEALVSIDVNTGKAVSKKKDVQKTFYRVNEEAALEIAGQLRLRDLSGMILIDFIDMESEEDNQALMEVLRQEVEKDPVPTVVVDMTKLGLVEVTRKRIRRPLVEQYKRIQSWNQEAGSLT